MILGIDEVGRGPWAGPLVVGAVVLGGAQIDGLTDSKRLPKKKREQLDEQIRAQAAGFGLGWVDAATIDQIGLSEALRLATRLAVEQVKAPYHQITIDGTVNLLSGTSKGQYVTTMKKADLLVPSVSAASIIAKVARDNYMAQMDVDYPGYGFANHVGYGTAAHIAAIDRLGVTPLHRLSFAPLQQYRTLDLVSDKDDKITSKQIGDAAENIAAKYLKTHGHRVLERNWKTKFCEIDIVSTKADVVYFCEVKYRSSGDQGGGLAAITAKKLRQMKFAAEYYALVNKIQTHDLRLVAISVFGQPPVVDDYLEIQ